MASELLVISGKGGTGKTSVVASFAALAGGAVLADCDVDAADLHLVLAPRILHREGFTGGLSARVEADRCTGCGLCQRVCRFDAVSDDGPGGEMAGATYRIDPFACEGCGVCAWFCREGAVALEPAISGEWFLSETRHGPMVHARLGVAEENSGKLVSLVRREARRVAEQGGHDVILIDGSPGIGCPVIASLTGATMALIVTEPTLSGLHDLDRVADLAAHFNVTAALCINKGDINADMAARIRKHAAGRGLETLGEIPYDPAVTRAQIAGRSVVEHSDGPAARAIRALWAETRNRLPKSAPRITLQRQGQETHR